MDTTMITGAVAITGSAISLYDRKEKKFNTQNAKNLAITSVAGTATTIAAESIQSHTMEQIHEKYASAYVESMSDAELEQALIKMDLLEAELPESTDVKTI